MYYINAKSDKIEVTDEYHVDITGDITTAGKQAIKTIKCGWFEKNIKLPTAIFYQLSSPVTDYFSGKPSIVQFTYYFEVRAKDIKERDELARELSSKLAKIYDARRTQYSDSFETQTGTYIKRITFTFRVKLGA